MVVTAAIFSLSSFKVLVDRLRGGVIPSWLPRRLGGGLGQRQKGTQRKLHKDIHGRYIPVPSLLFSAHISFRPTSRKGYMSYVEGEMSEMKSLKWTRDDLSTNCKVLSLRLR